MESLIILVVLTTLGYAFGSVIERRHFASIIAREHLLRNIMCFSARTPPSDIGPVDSQLVGGNVVISIDYFKLIAAALRGLIGGRVSAYETLVERARREAILRMKVAAQDLGATQIFNVKLETASIYNGYQQQTGSVEVYAYGTALIPHTS